MKCARPRPWTERRLEAADRELPVRADTVEFARKLVAADPGFAMGVYYLSAVTAPPENEQQLEKAAALSKKASDGERRFIEAMAVARANQGANFKDAIPALEKLAADQKQLWRGRLLHGHCRVLAKMGKHEEEWAEAQKVRKMIDNAGEAGKQYVPSWHYLAGYLKLETTRQNGLERALAYPEAKKKLTS